MKTRVMWMTLALLVAGVGMAQTKQVKIATKSLNKGNLGEAVTAIEQAINHEETNMLTNTWYVRGQIYTAVAANPLESRNYPEAANLAYESYVKALELDGSEKNRVLISLKLPALGDVYYNLGGRNFEKKQFSEAVSDFEKSYEISVMVGAPDTSCIYNVALCAAYAEDYEKSAEKYGFLVEARYPVMGAYVGLADVYRRMEQKEKASEVMDLAVERFSADSTAYISAASTNIMLGFYEKAETILESAVAKWPGDPFLFLAMGVAFENTQQEDRAEEAYLKALELNPNYNEAIYNLGAFYVNKGIAIKAAADNLPLEEEEKYEEEQGKAMVFFEKAIPYLEKVIESQPDNIDAMITLKDIYVHTKKTEEAKALSEKIKAMQDAQ